MILKNMVSVVGVIKSYIVALVMEEFSMRMKQYCLEVLNDFIKREIIKITKRNTTLLFDFSNLRTSFSKGIYNYPVRLSIGNNIDMLHMVPDVVSFVKDGNIITFNVKEIIDLLKLEIK